MKNKKKDQLFIYEQIQESDGHIFVDDMDEVEFFEGWGFPGPLINGKLKCKFKNIDGSAILTIGDFKKLGIYEVISTVGIFLREQPHHNIYSKKHFQSLHIRKHLRKGEKVILLSDPVQYSATDYWCCFAISEDPFCRMDD